MPTQSPTSQLFDESDAPPCKVAIRDNGCGSPEIVAKCEDAEVVGDAEIKGDVTEHHRICEAVAITLGGFYDDVSVAVEQAISQNIHTTGGAVVGYRGNKAIGHESGVVGRAIEVTVTIEFKPNGPLSDHEDRFEIRQPEETDEGVSSSGADEPRAVGREDGDADCDDRPPHSASAEERGEDGSSHEAAETTTADDDVPAATTSTDDADDPARAKTTSEHVPPSVSSAVLSAIIADVTDEGQAVPEKEGDAREVSQPAADCEGDES
jgi:hypothetical protein